MTVYTFRLDKGVLFCIAQNIRNSQEKKIIPAFDQSYFIGDGLNLIQGANLGSGLGSSDKVAIKIHHYTSDLDECNCCYIFAIWLLAAWTKAKGYILISTPADCVGNCGLDNTCGGLCE